MPELAHDSGSTCNINNISVKYQQSQASKDDRHITSNLVVRPVILCGVNDDMPACRTLFALI